MNWPGAASASSASSSTALGHDLGSSHGHTRIIRQAYYEHPSYVPLVRRAYERWYDLEQAVGRHLLTLCPCLSIGLPASEVLAGVRESAHAHARFHRESFRPRTCGGASPCFVLAMAMPACWNTPPASFTSMTASAPTSRQRDPAASSGRTKQCNHGRRMAAAWRSRPARAGTEPAGLILTAGPWAASLLRANIPLTVMRQVAFWFGTSQPETFRRDHFPLYLCDTPRGLFYGFPMLNADGPRWPNTTGASECKVRRQWSRDVSAADEAPILRFLREHLPGIDGPRRRRRSACTR